MEVDLEYCEEEDHYLLLSIGMSMKAPVRVMVANNTKIKKLLDIPMTTRVLIDKLQ